MPVRRRMAASRAGRGGAAHAPGAGGRAPRQPPGATDVAGALVDEFPDGAWLVELAPLADPRLVITSVAAPFGVQEGPGRPLLDALTAYLQPRSLVLLLDNCEHLVEACAELAERLLGR